MKYLKEKKTSICPLCSSANGILLYTVNCEQAARHFILKERNHEKFCRLVNKIKKIWNSEICSVICCKDCLFIYANPFISGDQEFYQLAFEEGGYPQNRWEFAQTKNTLLNKSLFLNNKSDLSLLEVGAGDGAFIEQVAPDVVELHNITATEFSETGIKKMKNKGVSVFNCDINELIERKIISKQFDIICLFQILEHMDKLDYFFSNLNKIASPNSLLFIAVPNEDRIEFNEKNDALLDMPPNHIGRWNKQTFKFIGKKFNWELVQYKKEPFNFFFTFDQFVNYRYLRQTQFNNSVANIIERSNIHPSIRSFLKHIKMGMIILNSIFLIPKMKRKNLGNSQWVFFRKIG